MEYADIDLVAQDDQISSNIEESSEYSDFEHFVDNDDDNLFDLLSLCLHDLIYHKSFFLIHLFKTNNSYNAGKIVIQSTQQPITLTAQNLEPSDILLVQTPELNNLPQNLEEAFQPDVSMTLKFMTTCTLFLAVDLKIYTIFVQLIHYYISSRNTILNVYRLLTLCGVVMCARL